MKPKRYMPTQIISMLRDSEANLARADDRADLSETFHQRSDVSSLATSVWRYEGERDKTAQGTRAGKRSAEKVGGGSGVEHFDFERSGLGKLLSPTSQRRAVEQVQRSLAVSERRACRVLGQPRNSQRYVMKTSDKTQRLVAAIHVQVRRHPLKSIHGYC